jgi:uncharacterized protein involved in exopolysaccharide biosynthesis
MELRHYLSLIWKWLWLIVLSMAVAGGASYLASKATTPLYRTSTTLMVGRVTDLHLYSISAAAASAAGGD